MPKAEEGVLHEEEPRSTLHLPNSALDYLGAVLGWAVLLTPIANPDLPWHLSAGRRIVELRAVPAADWLSWTRPGAPWLDFEWGAQLLYHAVWSAGGVPALFILKAAVLALLFVVFLLVLAETGVATGWRGAAAAALGALLSLSADLRPDHLSLLFFSVELLFLERQRRRPVAWKTAALGHAVLYLVWANVHAGFVAGLLLCAAYAAGSAAQKEGWKTPAAGLAAGAAGSLFTPLGPAFLGLLATVQHQMGTIGPVLLEWRPPDPALLLHRPFWLLLLAWLGIVLWRRGGDRPRLLAAAGFGVLALAHSRHIPYFALAALPATSAGLSELAMPAGARRGLAAFGLLLFAAFAWSRIGDGLGRRLSDTRFYPEALASYLEDETEVLGGLKTYHPYAWGGYLGWRLYPDYKVYWDGRYLFADLLPEAIDAPKSADSWTAFLDRRDIELVAFERGRLGSIPFRMQKGTVQRPAERRYMDPRTWALVYWDSQALLFVRRDRVDPDWLSEYEYRVLFPDDQAWLKEAVGAGQVPARDVAEDVRRYLESGADEAEKRRWDAFLSGLH